MGGHPLPVFGNIPERGVPRPCRESIKKPLSIHQYFWWFLVDLGPRLTLLKPSHPKDVRKAPQCCRGAVAAWWQHVLKALEVSRCRICSSQP